MHWIDPATLPETKGKVTQFLLNPHGDLDGLILDGNRQVHFPPHLTRQIARHIAVGDTITVRGIKPRGVELVAAITLTSQKGVEIIDEGPQHHEHRPKAQGKQTDVQGEVIQSLYGPKGELRGAILRDGTSLRLPPHAAVELIDYLTPGVHVQAWGESIRNRFGRTIDVHEIALLVDATESSI